MHHDEHFLDRTVSRLSLPAMERAMVLYNDSQLTRFILEPAKLPEDDRDVAVALAPGNKPEHTIVRRDGTARPTSRPGGPTMMPTLISLPKTGVAAATARRIEATLHHRGRADG